MCKIIDVKFSKPGKHGGAKKVVTGIDIFSNKKYQETFLHSSLIIFPKKNYLLMSIDDDLCHVIDEITGIYYEFEIKDESIKESYSKGLTIEVETLISRYSNIVKEEISDYRILD